MQPLHGGIEIEKLTGKSLTEITGFLDMDLDQTLSLPHWTFNIMDGKKIRFDVIFDRF